MGASTNSSEYAGFCKRGPSGIPNGAYISGLTKHAAGISDRLSDGIRFVTGVIFGDLYI